VIDAANGQLLLTDGVVLSARFNVSMIGKSQLRLTPLSARPPFRTLAGFATLAEGIPIGMTLVFCNQLLANVSFRFAYDADFGEDRVHAEHEQWLARVLGERPHSYSWGAVAAMVHPRDAEASVSVTWRGVSHLYEYSLPPARSNIPKNTRSHQAISA
jgi:hypothetical protein